MLDTFSSREKVDENRIELIDALDSCRKIFSSRYGPESILEDLSLEFHSLNDKTHNFIRIAMRHIAELEGIQEKRDESESQYTSV